MQHFLSTIIVLFSIAALVNAQETYYFSTSGNNVSDGLSEEKPRRTMTQEFINALKPGDRVLFKRGDRWHDATTNWDFSNIGGSAEKPIYFGAYGTGENPIIAKLRLVTDTWKDDGNGVWSVPWNVTQADTYALYKNDKIVTPALHTGAVATMANNTFFVTEGRLYLKGFGNPTDNQVEVNISAGGNFIVFNNSKYITFEGITFKGTSRRTHFINARAPTGNLVFRNLTIMHIGGYLTIFHSDGPENHIAHLWENNVIDRTWGPMVYRAMRNNAAENTSVITTDALCYRNAGEGVVIRGNTFMNWGHTTVNFQQIRPHTDSPEIRFNVVENNLFLQGDSEYNRAFEFCGDARVNNNIFRCNYVYGHTNSSHFLGVDNVVYGNIFDTIVLTTADTRTIQPQHVDLAPWVGDGVMYVAKRNIIMNNTFFGGREGIRVGTSALVGNNLIANNIFHSWWGSHFLTIHDDAAPQTVLNNVFWNGPDTATQALISRTSDKLTVVEINALPTMSGNVAGDPQFSAVAAGYGASNFRLQATSPFLKAGLSIDTINAEAFPAIRLIAAEYNDFYGEPFSLASPTIGGVSN